ncbi:glycosyltransferase family 2 protein [Bacillus sp. ISL-40]|uniref:glycosyltransferase family 2 protein n=1 Tax=unclassified Bacillus (in: firmicutes) TaxID=185979 RepID=UPI001BE5E375|nr:MULTISPECIES: glycosyltransferase family 2 protein [unclassified Bacillus (in: firmicutes)]MBT2701615.1 glycosyltransferase family 2 protein [Bacillus sp. ISL-40]MBT2744339.1 glycosyltransferase family 2 protein [Bacillus sp. ISL-77]
MKKVFCVCMVKNEADIIESFIRYHLNIFDGIVLLDNGSTDRTVDIITQLQSEGLSVYLRQDNTLEYVQGPKTTELINYTLNQFNPDLIFPLDVDEFLIAPNYSDNPRELVDQLSTIKVFYLEREYTYFPIHLNESELFIPKRITFASPIKDYWPKVVVSKEIWETYSATISGGNHYLFLNKDNVEKEVLQQLKLRHFPYRSLEHLKSKISVGWLNTLASHTYNEGDNFHWYDLFNQLKKNNFNISIDAILQHDETYVPMNLSFCTHPLDLKYTTHNEVSAISNLLNYCESLARNNGEMTKKGKKRRHSN